MCKSFLPQRNIKLREKENPRRNMWQIISALAQARCEKKREQGETQILFRHKAV
jgi:hypothetical protein